MNKILAASVAFFSLTLAWAASTNAPLPHHTSLTDDIHTARPVKHEPAPIELSPVYIHAEKKPVTKNAPPVKGCIDYPMYASGDQTVRICS